MKCCEEHGDEAERYVLTSLINEIHQSGTRMTLVIDDWQRVTDPATIAAMRYLLDNVASGLTVVVTSRSQSGLPMSRMRMQDELLEIDATALRFDVTESENFLVDLGGLDLDHTDVEELTAKTDGWVAALQLAIAVAARPRRSGPADRHDDRPPPRDQRVPRRERARHPGTVDARLPAGHLDHRADLR